MVRLAITAVLLSACAAGGPIHGVVPMPLDEGPELTPPTVPVFVFTVQDDYPEVSEAAQQAAQRWHESLGWKITIADEGGIPIRVWDRLWVQTDDDVYTVLAAAPTSEGSWRSLCGNAFLDEVDYGLDVATSASCDLLYILTHEMGHILRGVGGHSATGLMAAGDDPNRSKVIDLASWDLVCEYKPCWGEPEKL